ncbi:hypothetical protein HW242_01065 [Campylobacter lari]|uniref:Uncharacterized protein n=1 Tax=Campylobacter lari TaxID=201 RepID=A0A7M1MGK8_CAMLA|nr:hypothetical protein HW242_01065 [Campylobacter lari]
MMVLTDNKYPCSPFPFIESTSHIEDDDAQVGINDENNNGWEDDGSYRGQIFILIKKIIDVALKTNFLV